LHSRRRRLAIERTAGQSQQNSSGDKAANPTASRLLEKSRHADQASSEKPSLARYRSNDHQQ
jgi:hypothetical protein